MDIKLDDLNEKFIEFLAKEYGYQKAYPVSITPEKILWDDNHRFEIQLEQKKRMDSERV